MDGGGAARHDGSEDAFNRGDAPDCSIGDVDGLLINGASVVEAMAVGVVTRARRTVRVARVVVVDALLGRVVAEGLVTGDRGMLVLFQDTSKRVLVKVVVQAGTDGRSVVSVFGKLLGNVGSVEPGLVVFRVGGVVVVRVVASRRDRFVFAVASSRRGRGRMRMRGGGGGECTGPGGGGRREEGGPRLPVSVST
jgi:hypothetical protein